MIKFLVAWSKSSQLLQWIAFLVKIMMKCVGGQVKAFNLLFCTASDAESKQ